MPAHQPLQHVVRRCKDVAHIVKNGESPSLSEIGQRGLGEAEFHVIDEQRGSANRKARTRVARSCLIQPKSAMGVASTGKELFGQWNRRDVGAGGLADGIQRTRSWRQNPRSPKWLHHANRRRARKHESMLGSILASERMVGRVLCEGAGKVCGQTNVGPGCGLWSLRLRAEIARGQEGVKRKVVALRALQWIVAFVVNKCETRTSHARGQRIERNLPGRKVLRKVAGLHRPEVEAIGD